jgi:N-acetylneuraminic acid mutarotase
LNFTSNIEIHNNTGSQYNPATNTWTETSTTNAPIPRDSHTAVWTGSEMIIWGGTGTNIFNSLTPLFDGSRFNPTTKTWTTISASHALSAPSEHTAVWTGSEMIIWGGKTSSNTSSPAVNTGSRYNPKTDTWTAISTLNAPSSRHSHTAVWTGSEMIIWGGIGNNGSGSSGGTLNTGSRYNPTTNTWTTISNSNAPNPRGSHAAVWTGSEMIIWGGMYDPYTPHLNDGSRYNPTTNTWTAVSNANAPSGRGNQAAVWTGSEMIVWGGRGLSEGTMNTGSCYNPTSNTWTTISNSNAPKPRESHAAVWTGSEMIVWGGSSGSVFFNSGARYTPGYIDFYSKF